MVHNGDDENFCVARPKHHAIGKAFHKSAAGAFGRGSPAYWIGDRIVYRAFDSIFKLDAQSITNVLIIVHFLK
jgi:hypothetical protein